MSSINEPQSRKQLAARIEAAFAEAESGAARPPQDDWASLTSWEAFGGATPAIELLPMTLGKSHIGRLGIRIDDRGQLLSNDKLPPEKLDGFVARYGPGWNPVGRPYDSLGWIGYSGGLIVQGCSIINSDGADAAPAGP